MTAPLPPADIATRKPKFIRLRKGEILERFYPVAKGPIFYDRGRQGRFNAPDGSYGVLYAAANLKGAFARHS